jgi:hypothetical protein
MGRHGYLGDGYGTHGEVDPDRDSEDRDRDRRERHGRGIMFEGGDRSRERISGEDRPHSSDAAEWFGGREPRGFDYGRPNSRPSSSQDDHYRSWRERQMQALDRDYADYCREREQQFHRDFDVWRINRKGRSQRTESASEGELILGASEAATGETTASQAAAQAEAAATLGTSTSENTARGRR